MNINKLNALKAVEHYHGYYMYESIDSCLLSAMLSVYCFGYSIPSWGWVVCLGFSLLMFYLRRKHRKQLEARLNQLI